jgi:tetratricopeptide (TPR) repeat protein
LLLVETLNALANVAKRRAIDGNDEKLFSVTRDLSSRAAEIGKRVAPDSSALVQSLYTLCFVEDVLDSYSNAQEHCLEALRIQKKLAPARSMTQATILSTLGRLEIEQSHFALAHEYLDEALAIGESLAPESANYEHFLTGLAALEITEGNLQSARIHLLRALAIQEKLHGWLAPTYLNLGAVALEQDDFVVARDYMEKALDLFLKTKPNNVGVQYALVNLGLTADRQGDLVSALEYARRVMAIDERRSHVLENPNHYSLMGDILMDQGNLVSAAQYYQRALDIAEKIAPESPNISDSLLSLATVARKQGNLSLAMEYDRRALQLGQKSCPNYWCVTPALNNLGQLAYQQGDLTGSESYLRRAVDAREKSLGPVHPDLARSLNDLALTLAAMGKTPEALRTALRAESIGAEHLRMSARTLSERQALAYEGIRASGLDIALTLAADRANTPLVRSEVFDAAIRSRALVFDELAARRRSTYGSGDPEVAQLANQLSSARTQLATLAFRGVGDTTPEAYQKLIGDAREKKEKAERMLAERSLAFRQDQARAQLGLKEIAASVPQGAALLSFVRYTRRDLQKDGTSNVVPEPVPSYAAFVLRAGEHEPEFVPLGTAREIESLLAAWRREIARQAEVMDVSAKTGENTYRRTGAALRRRIWDPLVPGLGNAKEVLVVPDAALHLVSLASLPVGSSHYLLETGPLIHYLSTERDLVPAQSRHGEGILVVGNPAFDQAGKLVVASNTQ